MTFEREPDVLTIPEVAAHLRCSTWSVYKRIEEGSLHAFRVGRLLRVHRTDLEAFRAAS